MFYIWNFIFALISMVGLFPHPPWWYSVGLTGIFDSIKTAQNILNSRFYCLVHLIY